MNPTGISLPRPGALGLPVSVTACLFDLDGVLVPTAVLHNAAWTETFNAFLSARADRYGERPFDPVDDYNRYVDGKLRPDGVRSFLASRGVAVPEGRPDDPPGVVSVHGIGNDKNARVLRLIRSGRLEPYPGSVAYLRAAVAAGYDRAVVSSSANCAEVVEHAGLAERLPVRVDGVVAAREGLRGKPEPDTFLAAAALLGVQPGQAAVYEDAIAGVAAGRAGGFGFVVGVDRVGHAAELRRAGAHVVVRDLAELLVGAAR